MEKLKKYIVLIYIGIILVILPLVITNGFYNITETKYYTFLIPSLIFITISIILLIIDKKKSFTVISKIAIINIGIVIISTLLSSFSSAYIGSGRYQGCLTLMIYYLMIILFQNNQIDEKFLSKFLTIPMLIVTGIAILNYFGIDLLHTYGDGSNSNAYMYISTIGHVDFYSSYLSIIYPCTLIQFIQKRGILETVSLVFCSIGIILCPSDAIIVGLIPIAFLPIWFSDRKEYLENLVIGLGIMVLSGVILGNLSYTSKFESNMIFKVFSYIPVSLILIAGLSILYYFIRKRYKKVQFKKYYMISIGSVLSVLILILILVNFRIVDIPSLKQYLLLDHKWGNSRGVIWKYCIVQFSHFSIKDMIFGIGPDSLQSYQALHPWVYTWSIDAAHNELINYLFNIGIAGLLGYISMIGMILYHLFHIKKSVYSSILLFTILGYLFCSLINIAQPNTTPIFFVLLGLVNNLSTKENKPSLS